MRFEPTTAEEARTWMRSRLGQGRPFALAGAGTRCLPFKGDSLSTVHLRQIRFFHPDDMVIGVEAGTRFETVHAVLAEKNMILPVNPWFRGATVGGMIAGNDFGPERLWGGGLRDFIIGIEYLDGDAVPVKAGGRVVKNVTGYDVSRMMIGSRGGLGLITSVNFKVLPKPAEPHGLFLKTPELDWLDDLLLVHRKRLPLDWLQLIFRDGVWHLGLGISGNAERRERLTSELQSIFGHRLALAEDGLEEAPFSFFSARFRFGGFLSPHVDREPFLHFHGIFPTNVLLERVNELTEGNPVIVLHPFGGDVHLLYQETSAPSAYFKRLRELFSKGMGYLTLEKVPDTLAEQVGFVHPKPDEYALMCALKRNLDPRGIFLAPFYT